ncbi:MAG: S41 family peptidase [Bradymonadales bacterium]|nr:S41 family peptidase [Bradymonadales bacterium]
MRIFNSYRRSFFLLSLLLSFTLGYFSRQIVRAQVDDSAPPYPELSTFANVLAHIEQSYVDPVDSPELLYGAIKGMVRTLDPHSAFLTPEELERMRTETRGEYVGVGMEIGAREGEIVVVVPFEGGPAFEAGIQAGDVLLEVDHLSTVNRSVADIVNQLRGEQGVPVEIRLRRQTSDFEFESLQFTVIRDTIHMQAVSSQLLAPGIGYLSISIFQANVTDDSLAAIDDLEVQNDGPLTGLVLDLRNNPGGLLNEAIALSDIFLDNGVVVTTEGRNPHENESYSSRDGATRYEGPLVVVVNGGTASASEIVAGALQDYGRATLVGTTTFGKATVQSIFNFPDGSGLKLTVARYFTPLHRSIHENGLVPDILISRGATSPALISEGPEEVPPALSPANDGDQLVPFQPIEDPQLEAAFQLLAAGETPPAD